MTKSIADCKPNRMADVQQHDHEVAAQEVDYEVLPWDTVYAEEMDAYNDVPVDESIRKAALQQIQNDATRHDMHKLYEVLGLHKHANPTAKDIKDAYRRCAMQDHPDRRTGDTERFQKLQSAHAILGNPELKTLYDKGGSRLLRQHYAKEYHKKATDTEGGGLVATLFSFLGFGQGGGRR